MSFMVRMSILGTLLFVALGGLAWEYLVSIPGFNNAQEKLTELSDENIKRTATEAVTRKEIKESFSKSPSSYEIISPPKKTSEYEIRAMFFLRYDTYKFYHAMPWKEPNRIVISYKRALKSEGDLDQKPEEFDDQDWVLTAVYFNEDPPPPPKPLPRDLTDRWNEMPMAAGGGGGGGGKKMEPVEFSSQKMAPGKVAPGSRGPGKNPSGGRAPEQNMPSKVPPKKDKKEEVKDKDSDKQPAESKKEESKKEEKTEEKK